MSNPKDRFKLIPAVYLIFRDGDKVLLSRRANTGYQDGRYGLVAGHMEGQELATQAMVREAKEEAGVDVNPADLRFVHVAHRLNQSTPGQERVDLFFETTKWSGNIINSEAEKCDDLSWHSVNNLPSNTLALIKNVLTYTSEGRVYSEYTEDPE